MVKTTEITAIATVDANMAITIPPYVLKHLNLKPGETVSMIPQDDGSITLVKKEKQ